MSGSPFKTTKRNLTGSLSTIIGITLVLTMLGMLSILLLTARAMSSHFKNQVTLNIMMKEESSESEVLKLKKNLETEDYTINAKYISKDQAAAEYIEELGEDFVSYLGENPLPASIDLNLSPNYVRIDSIQWIIDDINQNAEVKEVVYHPSLIKSMNDNISKISFGLLIFSFILLVIAIALINNTIRLAVFSQRFIIKSMQLVGATHAFIRRPFILKGIWYGIFSAFLAIGIISGLIYLMKNELSEIPEILKSNNYYLFIIVLILGLGILISWASTNLAVRRFIRLKQSQLY